MDCVDRPEVRFGLQRLISAFPVFLSSPWAPFLHSRGVLCPTRLRAGTSAALVAPRQYQSAWVKPWLSESVSMQSGRSSAAQVAQVSLSSAPQFNSKRKVRCVHSSSASSQHRVGPSSSSVSLHRNSLQFRHPRQHPMRSIRMEAGTFGRIDIIAPLFRPDRQHASLEPRRPKLLLVESDPCTVSNIFPDLSWLRREHASHASHIDFRHPAMALCINNISWESPMSRPVSQADQNRRQDLSLTILPTCIEPP